MKDRIQKAFAITAVFRKFVSNQQFSGLFLIVCTFSALVLTNFVVGHPLAEFWHKKITISFDNHYAGASMEFVINDVLMSIFFLLIGLEIKRELVIGELSSREKFLIPVIAAFGGIIMPALLFSYFNANTALNKGWAIPTATDIAFALAVVSILGNKVPLYLKVFITALAVVDDLGAIIIIAIFYSGNLNFDYLILLTTSIILLVILNALDISKKTPYLIIGAFIWYFLLKAGIHPTLSGVIVALAFPIHSKSGISAFNRFEDMLHTPVNILIMPLFAFANSCIEFDKSITFSSSNNLQMGILAGLLLGKPLGIFLFSFIAEKLRIVKFPESVSKFQVFSISILGGIGFTMSIFITNLSFDNVFLINQAKVSIMLTSVLAALIGMAFIFFSSLGKPNANN